MPKIAIVVGARPNFMKAAPILHALRPFEQVATALVHSGQHYDEAMSGSFLRELEMDAPEVNLGVGSGSHGEQTGQVLGRMEAYLVEHPCDLVVVVGDVNSTFAAAMAAIKLHIPVAHIEAGLRSGDRSMPEEINRRATDAICSLLFATEDSGVENLRAEGVEPGRIHLVGNTMIDSLLRWKERALEAPLPEGTPPRFGIVTLHRPSNVDDGATLAGILDVLREISQDLPLLWPIHPRTAKRLREFDLESAARSCPGLHFFPPVGYTAFLGWMARAALILTDSGGIQEESLVLRVPVVTMRANTERPATVQGGGNLLAGSDPERIRAAAATMLARDPRNFEIPPHWDGHAGERIAAILVERLERGLDL